MMEKSFALEKCIMNYDKIEHEIDTSNLFFGIDGIILLRCLKTAAPETDHISLLFSPSTYTDMKNMNII